MIGATVGTFDQLFALVARATDAPAGPAVSRTQRLRLTREAASRTELRILAASSRRPGFPAALDELVSELQAALVDPVSLRERAAEAGPYELEIAALYESYLRASRRARLSTTTTPSPPPRPPRSVDGPSLGNAPGLPLRLRRPDHRAARAGPRALREHRRHGRPAVGGPRVADPGPWRPLRRAQGLRWRDDRAPRVRAALHAELDPVRGRAPLRQNEAGEPVENDGGVAMLASAGELAEVEAVGAEVARLLDDGLPPGRSRSCFATRARPGRSTAAC